MKNEKTINFIHIPKNGGSSIKAYLKKNSDINIIYNGHNASINNLENQMIIVRDPYYRFCSAVQYALERYRTTSPKIQKIYEAKLTSPNEWCEAWEDINHKYHNLIIDEVTNTEHCINSNLIDLKWTYAPQHYWVNEKKLSYIVPFENIESYFVQHFRKKIPHNNSSLSHKNWSLSNKSKDFIRKIYKKDFELIDKYKKITGEKIE